MAIIVRGRDFGGSENYRGQEPCPHCGQAPERKKERRGIIRRLGEFVGGLFGDDYDPWKVKEWRGTQEEKDQLNEYLDGWRITADEVESMKSQRPF